MGMKAIACAIAIGIVTSVTSGHAQEMEKIYRIGYLGPNRVNPAFPKRLEELGYVEGSNLTIVFRRAKRNELYPGLARELVGLGVNLILTVGVSATRAAKEATGTIPIVMGNSSADPVQEGLIAGLARPGGNVTGVFDLLPDLAGKRLALLKEVLPNLTRVAHFAPARTTVGTAHLKETRRAASRLGLEVRAFNVSRPDDLEPAFRAAVAAGAEAAVVVGVNFFIRNRTRIVDLEMKYRLPAVHTHRRWVPRGGLMSYTTDSNARYRRAAEFVDKIFKGAMPKDLPVERPTKYLLEVNMKTAKALGITVPRAVLLRANKVIE